MSDFQTPATDITGSGLQDVYVANGLKCSQMSVEVANANAFDLSAFEVSVKLHVNGSWQVIASQASDFSAPQGFLMAGNAALVTLTKNTSGWFWLTGLGVVYGVRLRATANGGTTQLTVRGTFV